MSSIDSSQALSVLVGSEGASGNKVTLAVPNSMLGTERGKNGSGFSFGTIQLDIGNNGEAKAAYSEILALGVEKKVITQAQADDLAKYAIKRPDMDADLSSQYKEALKTLNSTVFDRNSSIATEVNEIVEKHQKNDLDNRVVPAVNKFLEAHTTGVFDPKHEDYATAVASLISACNRSGNLDKYTTALKDNAQPSLDDAKKGWEKQVGGSPSATEWDLVKTGAEGLKTTLEAAKATLPASPADAEVQRSSVKTASLTEPGHPANALFEQARTHISGIDVSLGRKPDQLTDNAAAVVAVAGSRAGMTKIDLVELADRGEKFIAAQGQPGTAHAKVVAVSAVDAVRTSVAESSREFADAALGRPTAEPGGPRLATPGPSHAAPVMS